MKVVYRKTKPADEQKLSFLSQQEAKRALHFHESFAEYAPTPLQKLSKTADVLGVKEVYIKDESYRFGLNAFKVLGGSYAVARYLADYLDVDINEVSFDFFNREDIHEKIKDIILISATDGNHGRGVAWAASRLGLKAYIYMPKGSTQERLKHITDLSAYGEITEMNYDEAVRYCNELAEKNGWILVQDTAWDGYEKIPTWIMQGYLTMGLEAYRQLDQMPTHIFLQAGVGSMSGAMAGFFTSVYKEKKPKIVIVEPENAACLYKSAAANSLQIVEGDLQTIMAGLACGEPCRIGWEVLKDVADAFVSAEDYMAAQGMRILAGTIGKDPKVISGESGAAAFGVCTEILRKDEYKEIKEKLELNKDSVLLFINSEGDTDKERYRQIVWDGAYPGKENR